MFENCSAPLDVIIVGGGPAGLSAALLLGRCQRRVLVCDTGHPRNEVSHAMHGFLSRDGVEPGEFLKICREQLAPYRTVELRTVKVETARRADEGHFTVTLETGEEIVARTVLIATGVVDELPSIPGFKQFYGVTAHSCPYCDGWEHRDEPIAVTGNRQEAADLALEMRLWSSDVLLCADGVLECDAKTREALARVGIPVIETRISELQGEGNRLRGVCFADGSFVERKALFFSPGQRQRSPLGEYLGCDFCPADGCIERGEDSATCVPGVYAAGNASRGVQLVIAAAAEGTQAAHAINTALLEADLASGALDRERAVNAA